MKHMMMIVLTLITLALIAWADNPGGGICQPPKVKCFQPGGTYGCCLP